MTPRTGEHVIEQVLRVSLTVNGVEVEVVVPVRRTLADFLRDDLGLTGTHLGCEHGVCGACTVLLDGSSVRSCLMLAVQADGAAVTTIEGMAENIESLHPIQEAFWRNHGLQCGFCTAGMVIAASELIASNPNPTEDEVRAGMGGNLCRCTGYQFIVKSILDAAGYIRSQSGQR